MKITWLAHSCFELQGALDVLIDPYVDAGGGPPRRVEEFNPDVIAVTHGHPNHLGRAAQIARRTGCMAVANPEISAYLREEGARAEGMNIGGSYRIGKGMLHMTPALHSSDIALAGAPRPGGSPAGYVIEDGALRVYHAGDTGLFGDMRLIGEIYRPEIAMLPIGGRFTMGPREAAIAASWVHPKIAIPMHYNTFPAINQDPSDFQALVETLCATEVAVLEVGETIEI